MAGSSRLAWTEWLDLSDATQRGQSSRGPGLYRVRQVGADDLVYIGQTSALRSRMQSISVLYRTDIPYNDPHTAAPCLWVLRTRLGFEFEFSTAEVTGSTPDRKALESLVISEHRERFGHSPTANFGRMPTGWFKSSGNNAVLAARGGLRRGYPDPTAHRTPDHPCVLDRGRAPDDPCWGGLTWSGWTPLQSVPSGRGIYRVRHPGQTNLSYIGQGDLPRRLRAHLVKGRTPGHPQQHGFAEPVEASWVGLPDLATQQLLEIECDLIASHMLTIGSRPEVQFLG